MNRLEPNLVLGIYLYLTWWNSWYLLVSNLLARCKRGNPKLNGDLDLLLPIFGPGILMSSASSSECPPPRKSARPLFVRAGPHVKEQLGATMWQLFQWIGELKPWIFTWSDNSQSLTRIDTVWHGLTRFDTVYVTRFDTLWHALTFFLVIFGKLRCVPPTMAPVSTRVKACQRKHRPTSNRVKPCQTVSGNDHGLTSKPVRS